MGLAELPISGPPVLWVGSLWGPILALFCLRLRTRRKAAAAAAMSASPTTPPTTPAATPSQYQDSKVLQEGRLTCMQVHAEREDDSGWGSQPGMQAAAHRHLCSCPALAPAGLPDWLSFSEPACKAMASQSTSIRPQWPVCASPAC